MSITPEKAIVHANDYAVTCCRFGAGTVIGPENLEDPNILPELVKSGLLKIPTNCLKIGEVLGRKLKETVDGLTPLTLDILDTKTCPLVLPAMDTEKSHKEKVLRKLVRKHFKIEKVKMGPETGIEGTTLYIREGICKDAVDTENLVLDMKLEIITPDRYGEYSETIMDVQPVAVKEQGQIGEGVTRVLDGLVIVITGTDEHGVQISEFGSSEGPMDKKVMWGRPGSPDKGDLLIKTIITLKAHSNMERPGPMAAHRATDIITQEIRDALKKLDESLIVDTEEFVQIRRPAKKKVAIIKEIMGQGAMHDNFILPFEPVGISGAIANVDLGNVPVVVSPLQVLDGCIHALTCVGPASKETSRHYWREPLVLEVMNDEALDLCAVIFVGSPQSNSEKFYVSKILGMTVEAMDLDGAIVTTEGFGNNHIDFASHIEQLGKRGIPTVGMTYSARQGQLVVGNKYMDALIELNKSAQGIEDEILENNCLTAEDAIRAVAMLKAKMAGKEIKEAESEWNPEVQLKNIKTIEEGTGKKVVKGLQSEIFVPVTPPLVWTSVTKPLNEMVVALATAGGVHLKSHERFNLAGDTTYREIPGDADNDDLMVSHGGYDNSDVNKDINCMFPLDRIKELAKEKFIKGVADIHIGFMGGGGNVKVFTEVTGPEIAKKLVKKKVDAVLMTAG